MKGNYASQFMPSLPPPVNRQEPILCHKRWESQHQQCIVILRGMSQPLPPPPAFNKEKTTNAMFLSSIAAQMRHACPIFIAAKASASSMVRTIWISHRNSVVASSWLHLICRSSSLLALACGPRLPPSCARVLGGGPPQAVRRDGHLVVFRKRACSHVLNCAVKLCQGYLCSSNRVEAKVFRNILLCSSPLPRQRLPLVPDGITCIFKYWFEGCHTPSESLLFACLALSLSFVGPKGDPVLCPSYWPGAVLMCIPKRFTDRTHCYR